MNEALLQVVREAGALMLHYQNPRVQEKDGHANFVTEADVAVQAFLVEKLHALYPQAAFLAEEEEEHHLSDGLTFVIDPIDGTTNYMRRRARSVISVGAVEAGRTVFGVIYDPYHDDMYTAERGGGAWCNGEPLHVSSLPLRRALIGLGTSPYNTELAQATARAVGALLPAAGDLRRTGSAAMELCDIAAGRSDGCFEWILQPWDYCAGSLLVEEAGGRCGGIHGEELRFDRPMAFMGANSACYEALRDVLQSVWNEG